MLKFFLIYFLLPLSLKYDCAPLGPRILHGQLAQWEEYKFMAFLYYPNADTTTESKCAGTLISPRWILTAAHCIPETQGVKMYVLLGHERTRREPNVTKVYESSLQIIHKDFTRRTFFNDIALVKLTSKKYYLSYKPTKFTEPVSKNVTLVNLSTKKVPCGTYCRAVGWGVIHITTKPKKNSDKYMILSSKQDPQQQLWDIDVKISGFSLCEKKNIDYYLTYPDIARSLLWTKKEIVNRNITGASKGDSGGPLMCDGEQAGIISLGLRNLENPCDRFTRVAAYIPWIEDCLRTYKNHTTGTITVVRASAQNNRITAFLFLVYCILLLK